MKTGYKNGFENALGERENFDENNALPCNFFGLNIRRGIYLKDKAALSVGRETRPTAFGTPTRFFPVYNRGFTYPDNREK